MSRRGLTARLDASGERVLCGRCGAELAEVWDGNLGERHRRVVFGLGWSLTDGVWRVTPRAAAALRAGRRPMRHPMTGAPSLPTGWIAAQPIVAECPACRARQALDPVRLRTDPWVDPGGFAAVARWRK